MIMLYILGVLLFLAVPVVGLIYLLRASLPHLNGKRVLVGLHSPVTIEFDSYAIPTIAANSAQDAFFALGYCTAQHRLFQMDLSRRKATGRLSEILGQVAVKEDTEQRILGLQRIARQAYQFLPIEQREILDAYACGINAYLKSKRIKPPEFLGLRYLPETWSPEDSLLVGLLFFQDMTKQGESYERLVSVMVQTLPVELVDFLLPDEDSFLPPLLVGSTPHRQARPIPLETLRTIRSRANTDQPSPTFSQSDNTVKGSNGWCVAGSRTADGRAILANDMHLGLSLPSIWYRAKLCYPDIEVSGLTIPGLPMIISGSNSFVSWGFTNIGGKFLDLVTLEMHPEHTDEYRTPTGWNTFEVFEEIIYVKNGKNISVPVQQTIWGPVSPRPLLDRKVAIHWTALDPTAINIGLIELHKARTVSEAINVMHRFGGPPLNAMLVDHIGNIAWTICGKIPVRVGFDGFSAHSWADGSIGWNGYVRPEQMPTCINPPSGILASANNLIVGKEYPYVLGYGFLNSYRAYRIYQSLEDAYKLTEQDMFALQFDTKSEYYEFYRNLALNVLDDDGVTLSPLLQEARQTITAWNGRMDKDSLGIGLLGWLRIVLLKEVLGPYLAPCKARDKSFDYIWWDCFETPLRTLLIEQLPETLPDGGPDQAYHDWSSYLRQKIADVAQRLQARHNSHSLNAIKWGLWNTITIYHPLGRTFPLLGGWLNRSVGMLSGGNRCIRVSSPSGSAPARMVISPAHQNAGILHMIGGQSGHPLSPHYCDQQTHWEQGTPLPFEAGFSRHRLRLCPPQSGKNRSKHRIS